ncbi:ankyrin repeat domain-containing protein [Candidatus Babeliales bacterium]|nr:ankyrin repeat domain-containing protein [Candidatus Babeliales bacterium]
MKKQYYFFLIAWYLLKSFTPTQATTSVYHKILVKKQTALEKKQWKILAKTLTKFSSTISLNTLLEFAFFNQNYSTVTYPALSKIITFLDEKGRSLLHLACSRVNEPINNVSEEITLATLLIEAGSRLNQQDNYGQTPLHLACSFGKPHLAKLLLKKGADPTIQNCYGDTPLHHACWLGLFETVDLLVYYDTTTIAQKNAALQTPYDLVREQLDPEISCADLYKIIGLLASTNPSITQNSGTLS